VGAELESAYIGEHQDTQRTTHVNEQSLLKALVIGEDRDWEFKSARGGLPASLWETYSAMANTDGGVIVLGVEQHGDRFVITGLSDPAKIRKAFWDTINNRGKVSINLLTDEQAQVRQVGSKSVLVVHVPRASRHQRPVYVGQNPLTGTTAGTSRGITIAPNTRWAGN